MPETKPVDKTKEGWALELSDQDRKKELERMLWDSTSAIGFRGKCLLAFGYPEISLTWGDSFRSVTLLFPDNSHISAFT